MARTQLGNEVTARKADWREQMDISTPHPVRKDTDPLYHNLLAPNQWPKDELLPNFRRIYEDYMRQMSEMSMFFMGLIAESLELPPTAFDNFFDKDQQHKLKIVKYPDSGDGGQGVVSILMGNTLTSPQAIFKRTRHQPIKA